jgi:hypothetical protein
MTTDRDMTVPDDGPSVSIIDTICGSVVRTRNVAGFVAAVWLRRVAVRRHPEPCSVIASCPIYTEGTRPCWSRVKAWVVVRTCQRARPSVS